ncbi:peroxidase 9-like [Silene latifolia]|uniref:peroxidase 9-like n=1 Tax=Silene latifolia TaxID=37657 RepID=UPI003D77669A
MAALNNHLTFMASITLVSTLTMSLAQGGLGFGFGFGFGLLTPNFYDSSCPEVNDVVMSVLNNAIAQDPRMAASLLRLHFHDCFVKGCDASVLLDDTPSFLSEKNAVPNANSLRGFEVIDEIKARLEQYCPEIVSCADIVALAARDSVVLSGGPSWELPLGRRDSTAAYFDLANNTIPAPVFNVQQLLQNFQSRGLDAVDLVSLSGGHTIGLARCTNFRKRLYNQYGNNQPDLTIEMTFLNELRGVCPPNGGNNNLYPLDYATPRSFDNSYFKLIIGGRGVLFSDQQLYSGNFPIVSQLVNLYAQDETLFFNDFARSMVKMGNLSPLLGNDGEIRKNCHRVNYY